MKKVLIILSFTLSIFLTACVPQDAKISAPKKQTSTLSFKACKIAPELASPKSIEAVINLINALPRPLDIPCFISSLKRPLDISLTNSGLSAQPASGNTNPRIFIMLAPLIISISVSGEGSYLVEFAESIGNSRSIKGELKFPIASGALAASAAFDRINTGTSTTCGGCHRYEEVTNSNYPGVVYESIALRPVNTSKVQLNDFQLEVGKCQLATTPTYRCNLIFGLFNQGPLSQVDFDPGIPTFLESFTF